jgi:hypothetical protein
MSPNRSRAARYRAYALECERLAKQHPVRREALRHIAKSWREAAGRAVRRTSVRGTS